MLTFQSYCREYAGDSADPAGQFAWLSGVLQTSATLGESVLLVQHISPGENEFNGIALWKAQYATTYLALMSKVCVHGEGEVRFLIVLVSQSKANLSRGPSS